MSWCVEIQVRYGDFVLDVALQGDLKPVVLVGANGAGKSTVLRAVAGGCRPATGRIQVGSQVLFDADSGVDLVPEDRRVGYVPQGLGLFPHLTAVDNVGFGLRAGDTVMSARQRRQAAADLMDELGCGALGPRMPSSLSGGERQRVALARAFMVKPDLLLLDEPLSALDVAARRALRNHLARYLAASSFPAIVTTHDVRDVRALDALVYVLDAGRVVQSGTADELTAAPSTEFVAEFFGL